MTKKIIIVGPDMMNAASRVEVIDVPTPATYNHYTGNWKESPDGW